MGTLPAAHWRALGTGVSLFVREARLLPEARRIVEDDLDRLDRACSRFRDDSELAALNRNTGRWVAVGALFLEAIETGLRAARVTGGAVDPTIGRSLRAAGYDRDFASLPAGTPRRVVKFVAAPGWPAVELDSPNARARLPRGVELDLGATAKALGADRAAARVAEELGCGVLVNLGGDIAVAGSPPDAGWPVRVTDDHGAGISGGQAVSIRSGGLATSSTTVRRWPTHAGEAHHILDPSTGRPAPPVWRAVSVAAASCRDANTASTAAIVKGSGAPAWLAELRLPARLTAADGHAIRVGEWPAEPRR